MVSPVFRRPFTAAAQLSTVKERALYFLDESLLSTLSEALANTTSFSRESLVSEPAVKVQLKLLGDLKRALLTRGRSTLVPVWQIFTPLDA